MGYYDELQKMRNELETILIRKGEGGAVRNSLVYELAREYPVSQKSINDQLRLLENLGIIIVKNEVIFWAGAVKNGKKHRKKRRK